MDHIVKEIKDFNVLTETLIRVTYLKTEYRCPTEAERAFEDFDYNEDFHHNYNTTKHITILSTYGDVNCEFNSTEWRKQDFDKDFNNAKIHKKKVKLIEEDINALGLWNFVNNRVAYDDNHYTLNILSIEKLN